MYANNKFYKEQKRLTKSIKRINTNYKVSEYGPCDIDEDFYSQNRSILENSKGGDIGCGNHTL